MKFSTTTLFKYATYLRAKFYTYNITQDCVIKECGAGDFYPALLFTQKYKFVFTTKYKMS